jgi:hypothetical protein
MAKKATKLTKMRFVEGFIINFRQGNLPISYWKDTHLVAEMGNEFGRGV